MTVHKECQANIINKNLKG